MGMISRIIDHVRMATNEASIDAKYTEARVLSMIEMGWPVIMSELNKLSKNPVIVRHEVTFAQGTERYVLPPHVGQILLIAKINSDSGLADWEVRPRSLWNPFGPVLSMEGNILRLMPKWQSSSSQTVQVFYVPNGEISLVEAAADDWDTGEKELTITTATTGAIDVRDNAYAGYIAQITDGGGHQKVNDLLVTASETYTGGGAVLTFEDTPDFTPATGDLVELMPMMATKRLELVLALYVASIILAYEEHPTRSRMIEMKRQEAMRTLRLDGTKYEMRVGSHMAKDTMDNPLYGRWGAVWAW